MGERSVAFEHENTVTGSDRDWWGEALVAARQRRDIPLQAGAAGTNANDDAADLMWRNPATGELGGARSGRMR